MGDNPAFTVWIGYDSREAVCSEVASHSIRRRTNSPVDIRFLKHRELRKSGCFARPWMIHGEDGETIDVLDGKTFSTEFSHTRFLVPHLMGYKGWALFIDADIICLSDVKRLFALCDDRFAIMCVKHIYPPRRDDTKMDGRAQRFYHRKNWSSFVLWNCGHPANKEITPEKVNFMTGRDLHAFSWLKDESIGSLPYTYNFISGVSPSLPPERSGIPDFMHYSDGGPWFEECADVPYAEWWRSEYEHYQRNGAGNKFSEIPTTRFEA